jgi:hypothetical protein
VGWVAPQVALQYQMPRSHTHRLPAALHCDSPAEVQALPMVGNADTGEPMQVLTGGAPPVAAGVPPDAGAVPPVAAGVPPDAGVVPPVAAGVPPDAGAVPPDAAGVPPVDAGGVPPVPAPVPPVPVAPPPVSVADTMVGRPVPLAQ